MQLSFASLFAAVGLVSAILVIVKKEPMQSALFLIITLFSVAGTYVLLGAEFLAAMQVIIYAGAIMVLIAFVIHLTGTQAPTQKSFQKQAPFAIVAVAILFIEIMLITFYSAHVAGSKDPTAVEVTSSMSSFGQTLFTEYVFPFEIASVLLLIAIIGAVILAQEKGTHE